MTPSPLARTTALHDRLVRLLSGIRVRDALALLARLSLAGVFWRSLLTKVETVRLLPYIETINAHDVTRHHLRVPDFPLDMKASTLTLFATEYDLPLIPPSLAAWMATLAEFLLPIALLLGLFTRLSALALIGMTLVIQVFVYPEAWWGTHALWISMAGLVAVYGPGRISLDTALGHLSPSGRAGRPASS
ncbi:DoxX family protein [Maricaulis sp.]|uniref:DoxX family protein n=1 Tax=Maricaulis sp. TaxID=1486257 RepID=UPI002607B21F|nr:DoxX family protein [Maricaulis sp.]